MTPIINNLPSDNLPADVDYPVQADPIKTAADPIAGYQFGRYQIMGADRQMWIEDPKTPMCPVERSLLDITAMITEFTRGQPIWYIERPVPNHHDLFTGPGVLVVALMYRADGPMWSDIAIAQYKTRFPIDTLQHIYIDNCTNTETEPLVTMLMGGSQDAWYGITPQQSKTQVPTVFEYGTPSYQALLGSATGKAVAALILGAFPRGTWRIAKIACWYYWGINMRFDIEPVPQPSLYTES
ncbi:hypothetical protein N7485_001861 [Penicillium canescens]|nr:hypothetical protein N7485_001861 [Penicillium canescens]